VHGVAQVIEIAVLFVTPSGDLAATARLPGVDATRAGEVEASEQHR
jgi:hypothetical protein